MASYGNRYKDLTTLTTILTFITIFMGNFNIVILSPLPKENYLDARNIIHRQNAYSIDEYFDDFDRILVDGVNLCTVCNVYTHALLDNDLEYAERIANSMCKAMYSEEFKFNQCIKLYTDSSMILKNYANQYNIPTACRKSDFCVKIP